MIRLECTTGHNKFYELDLFKTNGRVTVKGFYGAIGHAGIVTIIYDGVSEQEAIAEMQKKQLEKQRKGYVIVGNGQAAPAPAEKKRVKSR